MRRLLLALIGLVLFVFIAAPASAQVIEPISSHSEAETYCSVVKDSTGRADTVVVSAMDMSVLDRPGSVEELRVHEGTHAAEMRANHALCHPTWTQLLGMETRAYCAGLRYLVARQAAYPQIKIDAHKVYLDYLELMQNQFLQDTQQKEVGFLQIVSAWFHECGSNFSSNGQR